MALDSYANLQTAVLTWLARPGDALVSASVPDMITLFEAEANRKLRDLGETLTALSGGNPTNWLLTTHPDAYLFGALCEAEPFIGNDERFPLWKARRDEIFAGILRDDLKVTAITSYSTLQTAVYNWLGRSMGGVTAGSVPDLIAMFERMAFRRLRDLNQSLTALSGGNPTNWLLTNHADAYLYGALAEAELFVPEDPRIGVWKAKRDEILADILRDALVVTAVTSYATLQTAVYNWLGRSIGGMTSGSVPDMIAMFESAAFRKLRHTGQTLASLSNTNTTNWLLTNHPDAYVYGALSEAEPFIPDDPRVGIWKAKRDEILDAIMRDALVVVPITDYASLQTVINTNWLGRPDAGVITGAIPDMIAMFESAAFRRLRHTGQTLTALSNSNTTNWLLTNHTDAYLYGALAEAEPFVHDDPRVGIWKAKRDEILDAILRDAIAQNAITDYTSLKTALYYWLGRPGDGLAAGAVPDMVAMFERSAFRKLRHLGQSLTALSGTTVTNWLLTNHSDAYLYGSLAAAEPFMPADPRVGIWKARAEEILNAIMRDTLTPTAITDYASLKAVLYTNWLGRPEAGMIDGAIPDMIAMFEAEASRQLKTRFNETVTDLTTVAGTATVALPTDFVALRSIRRSSDPTGVLVYMTPEQMGTVWNDSDTGEPINYTIEGTNLRLAPVPDAAYAIRIGYMQGLPSLSDGATTNWLLAHHPDAYLYGALAAAEPFTTDPRIGMWKARRDEILASILESDRKARWGGGVLQIRPDIVLTPREAASFTPVTPVDEMTLTLDANATSTILTNASIAGTSTIQLSPKTQSAASAWSMGIYIVPDAGFATVNHASSDATDMTFNVLIFR